MAEGVEEDLSRMGVRWWRTLGTWDVEASCGAGLSSMRAVALNMNGRVYFCLVFGTLQDSVEGDVRHNIC